MPRLKYLDPSPPRVSDLLLIALLFFVWGVVFGAAVSAVVVGGLL